MKKSKDGITVQCVRCKQKKVIPFDEARRLTGPPTCDKCYMPMVAISASTRIKS